MDEEQNGSLKGYRVWTAGWDAYHDGADRAAPDSIPQRYLWDWYAGFDSAQRVEELSVMNKSFIAEA